MNKTKLITSTEDTLLNRLDIPKDTPILEDFFGIGIPADKRQKGGLVKLANIAIQYIDGANPDTLLKQPRIYTRLSKTFIIETSCRQPHACIDQPYHSAKNSHLRASTITVYNCTNPLPADRPQNTEQRLRICTECDGMISQFKVTSAHCKICTRNHKEFAFGPTGV